MKAGRTRSSGFAILVLGFVIASGSPPAARADNATPGFQGDGLCRFALDHYALSKVTENRINFVVTDLLRRHEQVFNFTASTNLHVCIRIFGTFAGYRNYALTNHLGFERENLSISNITGFFSERDNEVVTWRQRDPTTLANNILHECSHAIMHQEFRGLPIWLDEGCAVYFSYPVYMRDAHDDLVLRSRWYELRKWLAEDSLPDLHQFLDISLEGFQTGNAAVTYGVSWSLFQLLMSTPENRRALNRMILEYQKPAPKPGFQRPRCSQLLNTFYPGGLAKMDKDWREWIAQGAANVLGIQ